jgi:hypothetical protein
VAEYKFGQLVQEEEKEQEILQPEIQEKKPYQFGQPIEPRTNDLLVEGGQKPQIILNKAELIFLKR